jgi:hypothetical protein
MAPSGWGLVGGDEAPWGLSGVCSVVLKARLKSQILCLLRNT